MQNVSSSNSEKALVPKLRFPEFTGKWKENKIGVLVDFIKAAPLSKNDISENGRPFILYGELYTTYKEVANIIARTTNAEVESKHLSKKGDVLVPTSGETPEEIATATCVMVDNVILAGDLSILRGSIINGQILSYIINYKANRKISRIAQGKSVVHVQPKEIANINICYPDTAEQNKLVLFFELLNKKIELQQQLIESLKLYKRGVEQRFFSALIDKQRTAKLGALCHITTGKLDANANIENGKYPFFTCGRTTLSIDKYAFDTEAILIAGNGDIGHTKYYNGKFNAYQRTYVLSNFSINAHYLQYSINAYLPKRIFEETQGGAMPYIKLSTLSEMDIPIFSNKKQNLICCTLGLIDKHIEVQYMILNCLHNSKQALLQQMFI